MTPKEKAEELITKFQQSRDAEDYNDVRDIHAAIRCALIAVDEIIDATTKRWGGVNPTTGHQVNHVQVNPYWQEVKQEIEKL